MKKVQIYIINTNCQGFLKDCLTAVANQDYYDFDVTFIDNGSTDDSVQFVRENFPQVEVVHHIENIGDYKALNALAMRSGADYIAILKPDAIVENDWLREMIAVMANDEQIFSVSPTILYQHNPTRVKMAGMGYTLGGTAFGLFSGKNVNELKQKEVFAAGDCGVLYRRLMFQKLDGYDDNFYSVAGDLDLSWRAKKMGYKNVICPTSFLNRTFELGSIDNETRHRLEARNNIWSIHKNAPQWQKFLTGWIIKGARSSQARYTKKARSAFKKGVVEGKATAKRMCRKSKTKMWQNMKIATAQTKYSFVNLVRFPK
ncbi:MAG: glycosyltransferase [Oscillospiraceae bacterium]|nr:glycosyltransferase [Oscillospiraceae bacterium]